MQDLTNPESLPLSDASRANSDDKGRFSCSYRQLYQTVFTPTDSLAIAENKQLVNQPQLGNKEKILVVEDSLPNQLVIKTLLERANYQVELADNGQAALDKLAVETFQLVLMDLSMPIMDGAQACRTIRSWGASFQQLAIWAMTANVATDDIAHCFSAGMNEFIEKPIDKPLLLNKLHDYFTQLSNSTEPNATLLPTSKNLDKGDNKIKTNQGSDEARPEREITHLAIGANHTEESLNSTIKVEEHASETSPVLTESVIKQLVSDTGEEVFLHVVELFINETSRRVNEIEQFSKENNLSLIEKEAHAIKSSAATIGAIKLGELAKTIEQLCKSKQTEPLLVAVKELVLLSQQSISQLSQYCTELSKTPVTSEQVTPSNK